MLSSRRDLHVYYAAVFRRQPVFHLFCVNRGKMCASVLKTIS